MLDHKSVPFTNGCRAHFFIWKATYCRGRLVVSENLHGQTLFLPLRLTDMATIGLNKPPRLPTCLMDGFWDIFLRHFDISG